MHGGRNDHANEAVGSRIAPTTIDDDFAAFDRLPPAVRRMLADTHYPLSAQEMEEACGHDEGAAKRTIQYTLQDIHTKSLKAGQAWLPLQTYVDRRSGKAPPAASRQMRTDVLICRRIMKNDR